MQINDPRNSALNDYTEGSNLHGYQTALQSDGLDRKKYKKLEARTPHAKPDNLCV